MKNQKTYYTFRLDDITPDMNWENFLRLKRIFDKHGMKPVIGIVPDCTDLKLKVGEEREDYWEVLKQLERDGWTMSMHGHHHQYVTKNKGIFHLTPQSEFAGLPYEEQYEKIKKGKQILEEHDIYTNIFFAPSNTYDKNTLRAVRENGFTIIPSSYTTMPYEQAGILFIPGRYAEPVEGKGLVTIYLHTNTIKEELYDRIDRFLEEKKEYAISYSDMIELAYKYKQKVLPKIELKKYIFVERSKTFIKRILRYLHLWK